MVDRGDEELQAVRELFQEALGSPPQTVRIGAALGDIPGWDSLGHLKVALALERRLGRPLALSQLRRLTTVAKIAALLKDSGAGGSPA